jgi:hypothetical protein
MPEKRAKRLYFNDHLDRPNGEYWNLPQRDLTEAEVERLSDAQYADATSTPPGMDGPLYQASEPSARRAKDTGGKTATKAAASAAADKADAKANTANAAAADSGAQTASDATGSTAGDGGE